MIFEKIVKVKMTHFHIYVYINAKERISYLPIYHAETLIYTITPTAGTFSISGPELCGGVQFPAELNL